MMRAGAALGLASPIETNYLACIAECATSSITFSWRFLMSRAAKRKEHPLSMRLPAVDIAIIDRAATLRGRSRTDFVRDAAVRAAEDALMETMQAVSRPVAEDAGAVQPGKGLYRCSRCS
jgi:hypothetical protein